MVNERRDDTTKPGAEKTGAGSRPAPGRYYYDDATGYETFRPDDDDDGDEADGPGDGEPGREGAGPPSGR